MKARFFLCWAFTALTAFAADVTGKYTAQVPGRQGTQETTFTFKQSGATLTGTAANQRGETALQDGKVDGDKISFKTTLEFNGNKIVILYKGTVAGDEIKFTRERDGGDGQAQPFTAKKAN